MRLVENKKIKTLAKSNELKKPKKVHNERAS